MSTPVPFGQYVPIESPVHDLDARDKIHALKREFGVSSEAMHRRLDELGLSIWPT